MQGGNLRCNATDCAHNIDCECKAGAINVSGRNAVSTEGTMCSSFVDKANSNFVNSASDSTTETDNILCEAYNCVYNENKACYAEDVKIDAEKACCDTFDYGKHN